jgi:hypothetical protein
MLKIGDEVIVRSGSDKNGSGGEIDAGLVGKVIAVNTNSDKRQWVKLDTPGDSGFWSSEVDLITNKGAYNMLKTMGSDLKGFIAEHKSVIYMIAVLFLADHILFQGAFRERLHGLMNKVLGKVEAQIDGKAPVTLVPEQKV